MCDKIDFYSNFSFCQPNSWFCLIVFLASTVLILSLIFRKGGIDAKYIIQVFATFATFGTILKLLEWLLAKMSNESPTFSLTDTDLVLLLGGLTAIIYSGMEELTDNFVKKEGQRSRLGSFMLNTFPTLNKFFPNQTIQSQINETPEAKKQREARKKEPQNNT